MLIVAHNLTAMNAQRQLGINTKSKAKTTEKLSSGYRINRAADDAAGLAISEKMRRQIRGLSQGVENTEDGVSLCQVADGALAEVQEMLHRVTELSVKAANGTNTEEDRRAIQQEINQILSEIERIEDSTQFNETKIFKGANGFSNNLGSGVGGSNSVTLDRNYSLNGTPIDKTISQYKITADITNGVSINGTSYAWNQITDGNGNTLADTPIQKGTYSLNYNGVDLSFDVKDIDTLDSVCNALNGLDINVNYSPAKTNTISHIGLRAYTPFESQSVSESDFASFIGQSEHTIVANEQGIMIDGNQPLTTWESIFGVPQGDNLENYLSGAVASSCDIAGGKCNIDIIINSGTTVDKLIEELNGVKFSVSGSIDNSTTVNAVNPTGTGITATVESLSLDPKFVKALGYDSLYDGTETMYALYNNSTYTASNPCALLLEFAPNSDKVSSITAPILGLTDESKQMLEQIFATGTTTQAGSVTLNFETVASTVSQYGMSTASIKWDYPAGLNYSDLWNNTLNSLAGDTALEMDIQTKYKSYDIAVNNVNTPEKIDLTVDDKNVNNTIVTNPTTPPSVNDNSPLKLWIQSGCESGDGMWLEIDKMNTSCLGIEDIDVSTVIGANHALDVIDDALQKVSSNRAKIGAQQNRLEHTIANEENIIENTTAAESQIRDMDMAKAMVEFSNLQILVQSGESMLAQANQSKQGVLNLLQ